MTWNETKRKLVHPDRLTQYGAWVPTDDPNEHPTLRLVLEQMLASLPADMLDAPFAQTDMTFFAVPTRIVYHSYEDPLGQVPGGTLQPGFVAWKVWHIGEVDGTKPMEEGA